MCVMLTREHLLRDTARNTVRDIGPRELAAWVSNGRDTKHDEIKASENVNKNRMLCEEL